MDDDYMDPIADAVTIMVAAVFLTSLARMLKKERVKEDGNKDKN